MRPACVKKNIIDGRSAFAEEKNRVRCQAELTQSRKIKLQTTSYTKELQQAGDENKKTERK
jgi:hypothetical protein